MGQGSKTTSLLAGLALCGPSMVSAAPNYAHYVVGNSKFFDVLVPVERLFAEIFELSGFRAATVTTLRKRTSKRELYEYLVSATKR